MENKNLVFGHGIPMGFGMALAQNAKAMDYFSSLSEDQRKSIIDGVQNVRSKQEMREYVNNMMNNNFTG
ncbi:MAG TPA: hypothetical protein DEB10_05310 [Ruminococcaceae bacterium]|nr:hypothetical protein [Oscillospiraceae bacterium]